jgi:hypothetical protein
MRNKPRTIKNSIQEQLNSQGTEAENRKQKFRFAIQEKSPEFLGQIFESA